MAAVNNDSSNGPPKSTYECTFCPPGSTSFSNSANWIRHETDRHLVTTEWVCTSSGCSTEDIKTRKFAWKSASTSASHHGPRPADRRTKSRPYRFEFSKVCHPLPAESRCSFCESGVCFFGWKERNAHVAKHFQVGITVVLW